MCVYCENAGRNATKVCIVTKGNCNVQCNVGMLYVWEGGWIEHSIMCELVLNVRVSIDMCVTEQSESIMCSKDIMSLFLSMQVQNCFNWQQQPFSIIIYSCQL